MKSNSFTTKRNKTPVVQQVAETAQPIVKTDPVVLEAFDLQKFDRKLSNLLSEAKSPEEFIKQVTAMPKIDSDFEKIYKRVEQRLSNTSMHSYLEDDIADALTELGVKSKKQGKLIQQISDRMIDLGSPVTSFYDELDEAAALPAAGQFTMDDFRAQRKALQKMQMDPMIARDAALRAAVIKKLNQLQQQARDAGLSIDEDTLSEGPTVRDPVALKVKEIAIKFFDQRPYSSARIAGGSVYRISFEVNEYLTEYYRYVTKKDVTPEDAQTLRNLREEFLEVIKQNGIDPSTVDVKYHIAAGMYASVRVLLNQQGVDLDAERQIGVDEDSVEDFLTRGGEIEKGKYHKPRKAEKWQGSAHIGKGDRGGKGGQQTGRGANVIKPGQAGKAVVTAESTGVTANSFAEFKAEVKRQFPNAKLVRAKYDPDNIIEVKVNGKVVGEYEVNRGGVIYNDYAQSEPQFESTGVTSAAISTAPGVGVGKNVGSLFGGSYSQPSPFKKKKPAKKESVIKRPTIESILAPVAAQLTEASELQSYRVVVAAGPTAADEKVFVVKARSPEEAGKKAEKQAKKNGMGDRAQYSSVTKVVDEDRASDIHSIVTGSPGHKGRKLADKIMNLLTGTGSKNAATIIKYLKQYGLSDSEINDVRDIANQAGKAALDHIARKMDIPEKYLSSGLKSNFIVYSPYLNAGEEAINQWWALTGKLMLPKLQRQLGSGMYESSISEAPRQDEKSKLWSQHAKLAYNNFARNSASINNKMHDLENIASEKYGPEFAQAMMDHTEGHMDMTIVPDSDDSEMRQLRQKWGISDQDWDYQLEEAKSKIIPTHLKSGKPNPNHPLYAQHQAAYGRKNPSARPSVSPTLPKVKPQLAKPKVTKSRKPKFADDTPRTASEAMARHAMYQVWNAIAPDVGQALGYQDPVDGGEGHYPELDPYEIAEWCIDANRLQEFADCSPQEEKAIIGLGRDTLARLASSFGW